MNWTLVAVTAALLAGCGGGDKDPPEPSSITLSGTAAKGAALAGAAISVKCAAGTGAATTGADGKYSVTITDAGLPCALKAAGTDGSTFHSIVAGSGNSGSFTANISPLTEMVVAQVAGAAPAAYFGSFGSGSAVPAARANEAVAYVQAALAPVASLTGINPLTDPLAVGNALDQKIDAVMAALGTSGQTLEQVTNSIVANPRAPDVVAPILAPKATACPWLKSGKYRIVNAYESDATLNFPVAQFDAVALTASLNGEVAQLTDDGGCHYSITEPDGFVNTLMVASSGMMVAYNQYPANGSGRSASIAVPEQTLPISEFAGTWNVVGWDPASGIATPGFVAHTDEVTFDATGQITAVSSCLGLAACESGSTPLPKFVVNASGGFDMIEDGANNARIFLFKTPAGKAVMVFLAKDGEFLVGTRKEVISLPVVGAVSNFREFTLNGNGTISALLDQSNTVTAVDATAKTVTRIRTSDSRVDTLSYNKPRDGLRYRAPNSCTVNGAARNCAELVQLQLPGITLSMSVGTDPSTAFMSVSIGKPN
jgi:hypothetical protein